jgi:hypothetical protein
VLAPVSSVSPMGCRTWSIRAVQHGDRADFGFFYFLLEKTEQIAPRIRVGGLANHRHEGGDWTNGRRRLPDRRGHELLDFEHGGIRYTAGVGRFEDGRPAEIFLNTAKHGTAVDTNARDAAVAASLLLQHGCPLETLRRALTRNADGSASGSLARALDLLVEGR